MTTYRITFTMDKSQTVNFLTIPTKTLTDAYLRVQQAFPAAIILDCKVVETKVKPRKDSEVWAEKFARYAIKNMTVKQLGEFCEGLNDEMREQLSIALFEAWHQKGTGVAKK